jgi:hypothetical protein
MRSARSREERWETRGWAVKSRGIRLTQPRKMRGVGISAGELVALTHSGLANNGTDNSATQVPARIKNMLLQRVKGFPISNRRIIDIKGCCGCSVNTIPRTLNGHEAGRGSAVGACSWCDGSRLSTKEHITVNDFGDPRPKFVPSPPHHPSHSSKDRRDLFFLRLCPIAATTTRRAMTTPFCPLCLIQHGRKNR